MSEQAPAWVPRECTLPTGEQPLRVAEFDASFRESVTGVERIGPDRLRLRMRPEAAGRAADLAVRESGCCSFFAFHLTVTGDGVSLEVAVPPTHHGVLDALHGQISSAAR